MGENLQRYLAESRQRAKEIRQPIIEEVRAMALAQRAERAQLIENQQKRWVEETKRRTERLPIGMKWLWQKASGQYQKIRAQNEAETKACLERDRKELHALVREHLIERQQLQKTVKAYKEDHQAEALRIRSEVAKYVSTATAPPQAVKPVEAVPIAAQMAEIETKIAVLSGDITMLQSALEGALISDDMRATLRRMIERTLETLHIKATEEKEYQEKRHEKEVTEKQAQLNQYIRQYAELQVRQEVEKRKTEANRQFYAVILHMNYALNGLPRWQVSVMSPPPAKRLNETAYVARIQQLKNRELLHTITTMERPKPVIEPETAVPNLRQSVLEAKEILRRAGLQPGDDNSPTAAPVRIRMTDAPVLNCNLKSGL